MDELLITLGEYGLQGIAIAIMVYFIKRMQEIHREERKEWRESTEKQHGQLVNLTKDSHSVLTEIKTMLNK